MRIAYVAAGAAGMYCGSCIHDNTLAAALIREGHEVVLIPTYTPIRTDEESVSLDRVFYGAVNVYLQQSSSLFRRTPRLFDRLLDRPALLKLVSKLGSSTDAGKLGALTLSVLRGEDGRQRKELDRLVEWLAGFRPQVVQLTNSMFLGLAGPIKSALGCPVACGLTGEDLFLDGLEEPARGEVMAELRRRAADADAFIATSRYYAERMAGYLHSPTEKMHVVPLGIRLEGLAPGAGTTAGPEAVTIGYLARICPEKGLHLLLEAFRLLASRPGLPALRLEIAGYVSARDRPYLAALERDVRRWGLSDSVEFLGEVDREAKLDFLRRIDLLSVPTVYREPKGLYVLEALAHAVPVVQPAHGAFPELVEATGGGRLVTPGSAEELASALAELAANPHLRWELGRRGREAVVERFDSETMARRTVAVYETLLPAGRATTPPPASGTP